MPKLGAREKAYNALVDALNDEDRAIELARERRRRYWKAAEALYNFGRHGERGLKETDL